MASEGTSEMNRPLVSQEGFNELELRDRLNKLFYNLKVSTLGTVFDHLLTLIALETGDDGFDRNLRQQQELALRVIESARLNAVAELAKGIQGVGAQLEADILKYTKPTNAVSNVPLPDVPLPGVPIPDGSERRRIQAAIQAVSDSVKRDQDGEVLEKGPQGRPLQDLRGLERKKEVYALAKDYAKMLEGGNMGQE
ncbi:MAG: hypothetical protein M1820_003914 [Bogoriella megaspora]|nr:MAG: hypothetical protein M1820_003914 [Bogoriella megaspora]